MDISKLIKSIRQDGSKVESQNDLYYPDTIDPYYGWDGSVIIKLNRDEKRKAIEYSKNCWSNKKAGAYGSGTQNTKSDPNKIERIGKLAEIAFAKIYNLGVDLSYREYGDNYDFKTDNYSIDVKCSTKIDALRWYIKTTTVKCDLFIFCSPVDDMENIKICGYLLKDDILNCNIEKSIYGNWDNYIINKYKLKPIDKLSLRKEEE